MIFTANQESVWKKGLGARFCALFVSACLLVGGLQAAKAASQTRLSVELLGLSYGGVRDWYSISLSGRFDVQTPDGRSLGQVRANPSQEQSKAGEWDSISIADFSLTQVQLVPIAEDFPKGFVCKEPIQVPLTPGEENSYRVSAYAQQGLFSVHNRIQGSGEVAKSAEFMARSVDGQTEFSFVSDEKGDYTATRALPNGEYRLTQMNAAEGTLPIQQAQSFTIQTYFGDAKDIVQVEVVSQPVPLENGQAQISVLESTDFEKGDGDETTAYYATLQLTAGSKEPNTLPLQDFCLALMPTALLDSVETVRDAAGAVALESVTATIATEGIAIRVQGVDALGTPVGKAAIAESLQPVVLENAVGAKITYIDAQTGEAVVPPQFEAGTLSASVRFTPVSTLTTAHAIRNVQITARLQYGYQYPNTDGNGMMTAQADCKPADIRLGLPSGKSRMSVRATCDANTGKIMLLGAGIPQADPALAAAVFLPAGARLDDAQRPEGSELLRLQESDALVFSLERLAQGISLPVSAGAVSQLRLLVFDPCQLSKTADNPHGASIEAESYEHNTLLDELLNKHSGVYAVLDCAMEGSLALAPAAALDQPLLTGLMYEDIDHSGTRNGEESVTVGQGVLLKGEMTGIYYGALTDEEGRFVIYGAQTMADTTATLITMLPENAMSIGSHKTGRIEKTALKIPDRDYPISYNKMSAIYGRLVLDGSKPLSGAEVSLWQEEQQLVAAQTDNAGEYRFPALSKGTYVVRVQVRPEANAFLLEQTDAVLKEDHLLETSPISLAYGQELQLSFGALSMGSIEGTIAQGEKPLGEISVLLRSFTGETLEQVTDKSGAFRFSALAEGEYGLMIDLSGNLALVEVDGAAVKAVNPYEETIVLQAGSTVRKIFRAEVTGSITGTVAGIGGGKSIAAASLAAQVSATTDDNGGFALSGLAAGDYTVYAPLAQGKNLPEDSQWKVTQKGDMIWISTTVRTGEETQLPEVRYIEMTCIQGVAYVDGNGDFAYAQGEQLMSGVPVALQRKDNEAWVDEANAVTDEYGQYAFRNLQPGVYRVASKASTEELFVAAVGPSPQAVGGSDVMCSGELQLQAGMTLQGESDIALSAPASLHFAAFFDSNENGMRGEYERPITGVLVEVMGEDGQTVLASGKSDATGEGRIAGIRAGEHPLRVTMPDGYLITQKGTGSGLGVSCIEKGEGSVALSEAMRFESGKTVEVGAAAIPVGSFSGRVWNDLNNNGLMDPEEPGIAGVTLTLTGAKGGNTYTLVTDETGVYRFALLRNDNYNFSATLPEGTLFARYSLTGGDLRSVFTVEGKAATRGFPVSGAADVVNKNVGVIREGVIEGIAFLDVNYNGIFDQDESGYPGVTLELIKISNGESVGKVVTKEDGVYRFSNLRGGEYRLRAILPDDGCIFTLSPTGAEGQVNFFAQKEGRRESSVSPLVIGNGGKATAVVGIARGAAIKGTVFLDAEYDGIFKGKEKKASGVKVELRNEKGEVVQNTATNANGNYVINGVMPGNYTVCFLRKESYAFTRFRPTEAGGSWVKKLEGAYGVTDKFSVTMGENLEGVNAGMLPSSTLAGVFFDDLNDNGLKDEGEAGMHGVSVRLYSENAEIDLTVPVTAEGTYFFDGVMPGEYTLTYLLPDHTELAKVVDGGNTLEGQGKETVTKPFPVEMGTQNERPLVGAVTLGTFEGILFHDANANGIMEEGEEVLTGLTIALTPDRTDLEIVKAAADSQGHFSVTGLRPANYQLALQLPEGYIFSGNLTESKLVLDTVNQQKMTCPWAALTNRVQNAVGAVKPATIQGYVFLDENRDGLQGDHEALMSALAFDLVDERTGKPVKQVKSADNGYVTFQNVRPGTYTVRFEIPLQAEPAAEAAATLQAKAGRMIQKGIVVKEGETFSEIHGGLVSRTSIGGIVALEENGTRQPQAGIEIRLYRGAGAELVNTVLTAADGSYRFDGLWPDEYHLEALLPKGLIFVKPDDPNYPQGTSAITVQGSGMGTSDAFSLQMAQHRLEENILYIRPAKMGDLAWLDLNKNGLIDGEEPMIPGVKIELLRDGQPVYETQTDTYGYYQFADVYPGTYVLQATAYAELGITKSIPELRIIGSCLTGGDGNSAQSDPFSLLSGTTNFDYDVGYVLLKGQSMPSAIVTPPQQDWTGAYGMGEAY